jgi:putative PIN family toxin of toxin-antitoxin system
VIVSGLLNPSGAPGRILDLLTLKRLTLLYDDRILAEYRQVLLRPRLAFDPDDVQALLDFIRHDGELVVAEPLELNLPDRDDLPFLEVAVHATAEALVTGNERHFAAGVVCGVRIPTQPRDSVCTPATFMARWAAGSVARDIQGDET